ncbi:A/G-specific adenine glycosylase [Jatrophihabitans telluris]|uniref:A/G-specific adenine glycosylase n=1 Tax=Jatrophihabitans telluris TaxID=2038343 RepID=A0ABY4R019_9ACTN|nr:A/G-specific adenine glycosylase [Jatrophihabitans telluris]UQX88933.1 A/G-specific adenine glycosylase [Jatrophihabitans telluris]
MTTRSTSRPAARSGSRPTSDDGRAAGVDRAAGVASESALVTPLLSWFAAEARSLPWRASGTSPWAVLVSEVMLQQTPVNRVEPAYRAWLDRWPDPASLAGDSAGEAVRMWGKLGYPGRALRLHACAVAITDVHAGVVPSDLDALLALPGVGAYTARAVQAFAYHRRSAVVDTNIRRVLARAVHGSGQAGPPSTTRDLTAMESVLPASDDRAWRFCAAIMELGAVVCAAAKPSCDRCPLAPQCAWRAAGYPTYDGPVARGQRFAGTDRQVRGRLMDVLRAASGPVRQEALDVVWPDVMQRQRAQDSLVADGLVDPLPDGRFALPT